MLAAGLAAGLLVYLGAVGHADTSLESEAAPDFAARALDGRLIGYSHYRGEPLLVNIWATWCPPCVTEMPGIERAYRDYRAAGLRVVAISIDDGGAEDDIRQFVAEYGLTFDILHDPTGGILESFGLRGVPGTFLVSREGAIVARRFAADWDAPENRLLLETLVRGTSAVR